MRNPIILMAGSLEPCLFKMSLTLIASISKNNVIGVNGKLPWHIPEDLRRFRELTMGHPVIMGRKTYDSIPEKFRPLPGRKNIVLSDSFKESRSDIYLAKNMGEALGFTNGEDAYIMGGRKIYELFLPVADKMEITRVHRRFEGDAFFPEINWNEWDQFKEEKRISEIESTPYSFLTYSRR